MCGICGWVSRSSEEHVNLSLIQSMTATLTPRGPDQEGIWTGKGIAFGHRRLSVMDPTAGMQPMIRHANGQNYVLIYNGELYNAP